jgi:hypothetical protein
MALLASLFVVAAAPSGAQSPASGTTATSPPSSAASSSTAPSAAPSSPAASAAATAPAAAPSGTDAAATHAKAAGSETDASAEPSAELLKEARRQGFKPKKRDGVTKFCHTDAPLGTRFESETCVDEAHLKMLVEQREDQRNQLRQQGACTGSACSGH